MARYTLGRAAAAVRAVRGLDLRATIDAGGGAGILLSTRGSVPAVLGLGVVDLFGESVALGLDDDEAAALRDALTAWLER